MFLKTVTGDHLLTLKLILHKAIDRNSINIRTLTTHSGVNHIDNCHTVSDKARFLETRHMESIQNYFNNSVYSFERVIFLAVPHSLWDLSSPTRD